MKTHCGTVGLHLRVDGLRAALIGSHIRLLDFHGMGRVSRKSRVPFSLLVSTFPCVVLGSGWPTLEILHQCTAPHHQRSFCCAETQLFQALRRREKAYELSFGPHKASLEHARLPHEAPAEQLGRHAGHRAHESLRRVGRRGP